MRPKSHQDRRRGRPFEAGATRGHGAARCQILRQACSAGRKMGRTVCR
jgi:hypothetical protein